MRVRPIVFALLLGVPPGAGTQDWPQWRGPNRDGAATGFADRASWPAALSPGWKVKVGLGHSSPVVVGTAVYVFTREGEEEVVSSYDLATGKRLWRHGYPAPYTMNPAAMSHGKGPKSTPVVSGGRVYTLGISGVLSCLDATTGKLVWRKDFSGQYKETSPLYGAAMSPVVDAGLLIAHVGGHGDGALTAFDAATGAVKWAWKGDGPGYASPVLAELGGVRQVVTQSQNDVVGLSVAKGELLWKVPFKTEYDQNAVTPVVHGQDVIYSGIDNGVHAVRIAQKGGAWTAEKAWDNAEVSQYLSSPLLDGDRLYGLSHRKKGQFFALDARTGQVLWLSEGRQGDNAAVVGAGNVLLLLTTDASLIVARKDAKAFSPVKTYTVADSPTWAHPVVTGNRILVKDAESLAAWRLE